MTRKKIAVRVNNWIGDVIMNVPALEVLRQQFPNAEIVAINRPWVKDILDFRKDLIDRCIRFDDRQEIKTFWDFWKFSRALRKEQFDMAFIFTSHFKGAALAYLAGIPVRVGFATFETFLFLSHRLARNTLPRGTRHQSENYLDLLNIMHLDTANRLRPKLHPDVELNAQTRAKFLRGLPEPIMAVHAGAAFGTAKRWLPERYAEVCRGFIKDRGGSIVLLGVSSEAKANAYIAKIINDPVAVNLCGNTKLKETISLISQANFFLSNDSGLMHVAAAFECPQVAIFGPTDVNSTFPNNPKAKTVYKPVPCSPCFKRHCPIGHDCMLEVKTEDVSEALRTLL